MVCFLHDKTYIFIIFQVNCMCQFPKGIILFEISQAVLKVLV
jgi:hypothetical protein